MLPAGARVAATCAARAAGVGWSKATVADTAMPNSAMSAFLSSTAPSESKPACMMQSSMWMYLREATRYLFPSFSNSLLLQ